MSSLHPDLRLRWARPRAELRPVLTGLLAGGTGPGGRIVKRDILAAIERGPVTATQGGNRILARVPMQGMRKVIAQRMTQSLQEAAQLTSGWEADITNLLAMRQSFLQREEQLGTRVSMNAPRKSSTRRSMRKLTQRQKWREGAHQKRIFRF